MKERADKGMREVMEERGQRGEKTDKTEIIYSRKIVPLRSTANRTVQ